MCTHSCMPIYVYTCFCQLWTMEGAHCGLMSHRWQKRFGKKEHAVYFSSVLPCFHSWGSHSERNHSVRLVASMANWLVLELFSLNVRISLKVSALQFSSNRCETIHTFKWWCYRKKRTFVFLSSTLQDKVQPEEDYSARQHRSSGARLSVMET